MLIIERKQFEGVEVLTPGSGSVAVRIYVQALSNGRVRMTISDPSGKSVRPIATPLQRLDSALAARRASTITPAGVDR